ncbi:MotA/TolQ/ExbB proton channel family protein [Psychrobium sp. 1_MG-2023]|uniref:MotA/TolQ/ExbB proton channel family protein n=1 Tax=Psychrobium sp. 1_MG-2023 TaxID=3062624 RepID=UPI000C31CB26|nr:MotA/TolQ/ExbB proton channel family protein [Psychrobium sp. 1_MG-2023]MDP2560439.1 MotA/TolQ/ExbB proton channel family protein [Psychrobium sp. 1_MG-2023]PKF57901.1 flagellar motor protein MotA [Alteromonadales bacterium alter-6D02]
MDYGMLLGWLHQFVALLLYPVIITLAIALMATLWELGMASCERLSTLRQFERVQQLASAKHQFQRHATKRLERVDLLARSGPILGLMGTLIPLGPGLTALGTGNIDILATALTVAFDTTVVGLLIGLVAYTIGRLRRRWYEQTWQALSDVPE